MSEQTAAAVAVGHDRVALLRESLRRGFAGVAPDVLDQLDAALVVVDAALTVCERLDEAREWNYERGRWDAVKSLDFAVGTTLSLRKPLEDFSG